MKTYNITVNGTVYQVSVEETSVNAPAATPAAAPAAPAAPVAAPAPVATPAGATVIKAPMQGNVIKINFQKGDSVKRGDVLCVLEAMKMENDICAPADGVIASVNVTKGASVATDAVLFSLN